MMFFLLLNSYLIFQNENPPGTIAVGDFYVDKTEILNIHWLEYQYYLKKELDESEYWKISPDSSNNWYELRETRYEPTTLITYEQAKAYCEWRSEVVSENFGIDITYRLPTEIEWDLIAETIISKEREKIIRSLNKLNKSLVKKKDQYFLQKRESPGNNLYDLFSNVSEMTATKGIAKGGNNVQLFELENINQTIKYNEPNPYLGFHCIAEIRNANNTLKWKIKK
jgi:formylglycine-generating enzyme required for sulfatase activity